MTREEMVREMRAHTHRNVALLNKLREHCKHLEPTLRDHGANHAADRLAAILGELEVNDAKITEAVNANPKTAASALVDMMERGR